MRNVPIMKEVWNDLNLIMEKFAIFSALIVGDVAIFVVTILCMLWFEKPRDTRLVRIAKARICRPGKRKRDRRIPRNLWLWVLYWQGMNHDLCQLGMQSALAAHVPSATEFEKGYGQNWFGDEVVMMSLDAGSGQQGDPTTEASTGFLMDNPEVVANEDDEVEAMEDTGTTGGTSPDESGGLNEPLPGEGDAEELGQSADEHLRGIDSPDWNNVFQFRRHYSMRHCFVRWTTYRNIISGIAHTWDVSQDDVYAVHDMPVHPPGIVTTSQPVIVQIWGDDLPHEVGMSVLVDLEMYFPAAYRESHLRDRHVRKMPQYATRLQILQNSQTAALCETRNNRCLVRHNNVLVPLQSQRRYEVNNGDYFLIQVPPLEDCILEEAHNGMSLVQKKIQLRKGYAGKAKWDQALGNVEDATRDLAHGAYSPCKYNQSSEVFANLPVSERSSTRFDVFIAAFPTSSRSWQVGVGEHGANKFVDRDPTEGLPDPGNPLDSRDNEPEVFLIGSSEGEMEEIDNHDHQAVRLKISTGWRWTDILKVFQRWHFELQIDIPECCELSALSLQFLSGCKVGLGQEEKLWIYTDGSYNRQQGLSSFAVAIFGTDSSEAPHAFGGWFGGLVEIDPEKGNYTGAHGHASIEAEASALIWAHAWLLQSGFMGEVHICFDSMMAGYGASGDWQSSTSCTQISRLREIAQLYGQVRVGSKVVFEHVKAHSGQPANELVDSLAKTCLTCENAQLSPFLPKVDWRPLFDGGSDLLAWAWWIVQGVAGHCEIPNMVGDAFTWTYTTDRSEQPPIKQIEKDNVEEPLPMEMGVKPDVIMNLQVATYNVLSLNRRAADGAEVESSRAALLRQQLEFKGYHIIGLQETRSNCTTTFIAEDYIRVVSGNEGSEARYGCEVWLARRLPFGRVQEDPIHVDHKKITVLFAEPRLLAVRIQLRGTSLFVVSGHAPHEGDMGETKDRWWAKLDMVLKRFAKLGRVIVLGDFNARVGVHQHDMVGDLCDPQSNDNGERLHTLCGDHSLWIPSTFSEYHRGQQHTWVHPKGTVARIDYILVDHQLRDCVQWSQCDPTIQVANSSIDHTLVGLGLSWIEQGAGTRRPERRVYDWDAMATEGGKQQLQSIVRQLPEVDWGVDTHLHWQILEDGLHQGLQEHFPAKKKSARAEIFGQQTWDFLKRRKQLRQHLNDWDGLWEALTCRRGLKAWKDGLPLQAVNKLLILEQYILLALRQSLLLTFRLTSKEVRKSADDDKAIYVDNIGKEAAGQNNTEIFKTLKKLRVGSSFRKKALTPLPLLQGQDGEALQLWEDRDDRWREQCSRMEAGVLTTTDILMTEARKRSHQRLQRLPEHELRQIPSLRELEGAFRRIQPRKSPGVDNIRSDICRLAAVDLARKYHPLLAKIVTTYSEPVQMKGGMLVAAHKGGSTASVDNYRSLLLSSHIGKALRRTLRPKLVELYTGVAPSLHVSVKAGGNVTHASHALRSFLGAAERMKHSTATLYLDVKSAYYRVIRQLASNLTSSDEDIARVMKHFDLEPEEMHCLLEEIKQRSALKEAGATEHDELLLEELLQHTWFTTSTQRHITESLAGTRPGDGLADVVFSFVFQRLLKRVHEEIQEAFTWENYHIAEEVDITKEPAVDIHLPPLIEVVRADDLAFALHASTPTEAVLKIKLVAQHLFQKCLCHGMQPNMARNKTEIMLSLRGPGSRHLKKELFNQDVPTIQIEGVPQDYENIKLTGTYKHLGHRLQLGDDIMAEIKSRTGQACSVFRKYRRHVFQNPRIQLAKRRYLFQTLVMSILRYNMGTWPRLSGKSWHYFQSRVMKMYRGIIRTTVKEPELRFWNNDRVLSFLELPSPAALLHDARLRYSLSLLRHGPKQLWTLLIAEREWLALLRESIDWMQEQLVGYGPDRQGNPFAPNWNQWFREQPTAIKGWISKAVRHHTLQHHIKTQWEEWHHTFMLECRDSGLQVDFPWTSLDGKASPQAQKLEACLQCGQLFKGKTPWAVHAFKRHGRINWRRRFISTRRCEGCMKEFSTTTRLLHHLTYNTECADTVRRHLDPVEARPGRNSRREDKDGAMKVPVIRAEGPVREWGPELEHMEDPDLDVPFVGKLLDRFDEVTEQTNVETAVEAYRQTFLGSCNSFTNLCYTYNRFFQDMLPDEECPRTIKQRRVLQMVQDKLRLGWFFEEQDIEMAGPLPEAEDLRGNAWKYCSVDRRLKRWTLNRHDPQNFFSDFVIVHLFSGERRAGDLESFLEEIRIPPRSVRVIISVDIIYDSRNADLSQEDVQKRWLGFIVKGLIAVLYTGPPCETWSSLRALGGIAGYSCGDNGPRMLRTAEWVRGLPGLKLKEARQVLMANVLLTFSILAILLMMRAQRTAVLEHPGLPREAWMPSIWRLHAIALLTQHPRIQIHHILQGKFGGHSPKPTSLMIVSPNHAEMDRILKKFGTSPLPKAIEMGRKGGEYATAKLKNYPPQLCNALAECAEWWGDAVFVAPASTKSDIDFLAYVSRLRCGFNLAAGRGQDYARN